MSVGARTQSAMGFLEHSKADESPLPAMRIPIGVNSGNRGVVSGTKHSISHWTLGGDAPLNDTEKGRFPQRSSVPKTPDSIRQRVASPRSEKAGRAALRERMKNMGRGSVGTQLLHHHESPPSASWEARIMQTYQHSWSPGCDVPSSVLDGDRFPQRPVPAEKRVTNFDNDSEMVSRQALRQSLVARSHEGIDILGEKDDPNAASKANSQRIRMTSKGMRSSSLIQLGGDSITEKESPVRETRPQPIGKRKDPFKEGSEGVKPIGAGDMVGEKLVKAQIEQKEARESIKISRGRSQWSFEAMFEPIVVQYEEIPVSVLDNAVKLGDILPPTTAQDSSVAVAEEATNSPVPTPNHHKSVAGSFDFDESPFEASTDLETPNGGASMPVSATEPMPRKRIDVPPLHLPSVHSSDGHQGQGNGIPSVSESVPILQQHHQTPPATSPMQPTLFSPFRSPPQAQHQHPNHPSQFSKTQVIALTHSANANTNGSEEDHNQDSAQQMQASALAKIAGNDADAELELPEAVPETKAKSKVMPKMNLTGGAGLGTPKGIPYSQRHRWREMMSGGNNDRPATHLGQLHHPGPIARSFSELSVLSRAERVRARSQTIKQQTAEPHIQPLAVGGRRKTYANMNQSSHSDIFASRSNSAIYAPSYRVGTAASQAQKNLSRSWQ